MKAGGTTLRKKSVAEDGGDEIAAVIAMGSIRQGFLPRKAGGDFVATEDVSNFDGVGHGLNAIGVNLSQLVNVAHNIAEFGRHRGEFFVGQLQATKQSDFLDVSARDTHGSYEHEIPRPFRPGMQLANVS